MDRKTLLQLGREVDKLKAPEYSKKEAKRSEAILAVMGCCLQAYARECPPGHPPAVQAQASGEIIFGLLYDQGKEIPPLSKHDCESIMGDHYGNWDRMMTEIETDPSVSDAAKAIYRNVGTWVELRIGKDRIEAMRADPKAGLIPVTDIEPDPMVQIPRLGSSRSLGQRIRNILPDFSKKN